MSEVDKKWQTLKGIINGDNPNWSNTKLNRRWISKEEKLTVNSPFNWDEDLTEKAKEAEKDVVRISIGYAKAFGDFELLKHCKDLGML